VKDDLNLTTNHKIDLRPIGPGDEDFLYQVYASVRGEELAACGWSEEQQKLFLNMQLKARGQSYLMYYPELDDKVILHNEKPVGRLIVSRSHEAVRLVDITLLPDCRCTGIGTALIRNLFNEAKAANKPVRLQVENTNPLALTLYQRLGFMVTGETQTHIQMERACPMSQV
jgi:ribosomal protein S18 acetylase RimI-like enzyme